VGQVKVHEGEGQGERGTQRAGLEEKEEAVTQRERVKTCALRGKAGQSRLGGGKGGRRGDGGKRWG